jgi:CubicO group peptidase (beta-lactamase class C family)
MPNTSSESASERSHPMSHEIVDPASVGVHPERLQILLDRVRADVEAGPLPSAQIAVAKDGHLVAYEAYGDTTKDLRYIMQSAGRPIVAAIAWKLMSDGLLDPDERVADTVPEFATNGKDVVTMRQVLTHTGGFPMAPLGFPKMLDYDKRLEAFAKWRLSWEPGSRFEYHLTSAAWVLAEMCLRRTGKEIWDYLHDAIAEPLGLSIELHVPVERQAGTIAPIVPIGLPPGEEPPIDPWGPFYLLDPNVLAAGEASHSIVATAADVALLFQALYHSGLWSAAAVAEGTREQVSMESTGYAGGSPVRAGLFVLLGGAPTMSASSFGHGGAPSQLSWCDPETGMSFCFTTNGYPATGYDIGRAGRNRSTVIATLAGDVVDA